MAYSPDAIMAVYPIVKRHLPSMRVGGVYANKAGYHNSRNNHKRSRPNDYSITDSDRDLKGDGNAASGIDLTFATLKDQITASRRMRAAVDGKDPRLLGHIREWFGSFDGKVVVGDSLFRGRRASADKSHLWHVHLSGYRQWANDEKVWLGIAEVLSGLKAGTLTGSLGSQNDTKPDKVDEPVKYPNPKGMDHRPLISRDAVRKALRDGSELENGEDGKQYQKLLNLFTGSNLYLDGDLGDNSRYVTALAQLAIARENGNKTLTEDDCWHETRDKWHPDLDGIPGNETFRLIGADNSDTAADDS